VRRVGEYTPRVGEQEGQVQGEEYGGSRFEVRGAEGCRRRVRRAGGSRSRRVRRAGGGKDEKSRRVHDQGIYNRGVQYQGR
jgi:hypothetical protein